MIPPDIFKAALDLGLATTRAFLLESVEVNGNQCFTQGQACPLRGGVDCGQQQKLVLKLCRQFLPLIADLFVNVTGVRRFAADRYASTPPGWRPSLYVRVTFRGRKSRSRVAANSN
jgi:hypothetical protein